MATATIKPVKPVERTVLLKLSETEARALMFVSECLAGPVHGPRGSISNAAEALGLALGYTPSDFYRVAPFSSVGNLTVRNAE